jgi:hypothetical protein
MTPFFLSCGSIPLNPVGPVPRTGLPDPFFQFLKFIPKKLDIF